MHADKLNTFVEMVKDTQREVIEDVTDAMKEAMKEAMEEAMMKLELQKKVDMDIILKAINETKYT